MSYKSLILAEPTLVSFVPCYETTGPNQDIVVGDHNTTTGTAPTYGVPTNPALGGFGTKLSNAGSISWTNPLHALSATDFTAEAWFNSTSPNIGPNQGPALFPGAGLIQADITAPNNDWGIAIFGNSQPVMEVGNPDFTEVVGPGNYSDGNWHHVVGTYTEATGVIQLYIDGVLIGTNTTSNPGGKNGNTTFSAGFGSLGWVATICNLAIYTSVLSSTDIQAHYTAGTTVTVPNIVGLTQFAANNSLYVAGLVPGTVGEEFSPSVPQGSVISQNPFAGTTETTGAQVNYTLSLGPPPSIVPDLTNEPIIAAELLLAQDGFTTGTITFTQDSAVGVGNVSAQDPIAGTSVPPGTPVNLTISVTSVPFDPDQTVISQYSNSPTLMQLVENMSTYLNPRTNLLEFYFAVWNIATAEGFGLDIWGRIVGVSRVIPIPGTSGSFGFANADVPPDWQNFGNVNNNRAGGPFFGGGTSTGSYTLNDGSFRTLILTKALANICATTAPALNQLITNLFPGRGTCYVNDLGNMKMRYVFEFSLTSIEYAILAFSGVLPHPAGVGVSILVVPPSGNGSTFGFAEAGQSAQPFNFGTFYNP